MVERDCSKHIKKVTAHLDTTELKKKQHTNLIAALLRQIADYTDGWCSTELAKDEDLVSPSSMVFYFTTDKKRTQFINRVGFYLREDIDAALTVEDA